MKKKLYAYIGYIALLVSSIFSIFSIAANAEHNQGIGETEKVVVAQFGKERFLLYLPLYIAMEEGLFAKRGLEIDLRFVGNDDQIFASVISGDALFGVGDPVFAAISREKGGPGKIVAMMVTRLGLSGYTNNAELPMINKPEDARGLRIGSFAAPSTIFTLLTQFIQKNDLAKTGARIVQASVGAQLAALEAGQVDIAVDLEPAVSIVESKGYRIIFHVERFTEPQAITGISTRESTIQNKPKTVQKLVSGLQEAIELLHSSKDLCAKVAKKLFPTLSEQVIENAVNRMLAAGVFPRSVRVENDYWQRTLTTRLDSGELEKPQTTEFTVDNQFAEIALKEGR